MSWTQNTGYPEKRIEAGTGDGPNMEREHELFSLWDWMEVGRQLSKQ